MRYIDRILQPGETVIQSTTIHWIIYLPYALILLVALFALTQMSGSSGPIWGMVAIAFGFFGGAGLFAAWFKRWTTEIDVTDRRIVYKRGFIRRHTVEMNMQKVESVDVDQTLTGRLFNYGTVTIRGTGSSFETLRMIDAPLKLRSTVTAG